MADTPFSKRHGYTGRAIEITVREDAPERLRFVLLDVAKRMGVRPSTLRDITCSVLKQRPDPNNWSEYPNILGEVEDHVYGCDWYRVYDIIERIWVYLDKLDPEPEPEPDDFFAQDAQDPELSFCPQEPKARKICQFERELNEFFIEEGIGWQLANGQIITRGEESFESQVRIAQGSLEDAGRPTASRRIHDALQSLSRRPEPDSAGAISHAIAALECVAGDIIGNEKATFGDILKSHPDLFPGGLKKGLEGVWGYACNEGARHGKEGRVPERDEAELVVGLAASVATYLNRKSGPR